MSVLILKVLLHEVYTAKIFPKRYPKALGILIIEIIIDFFLYIPNWSTHTGKYIDMKDCENPVNILQNIKNTFEEIIVGKYKENIDIIIKKRMIYFLFILFIIDKENIPPNVVPKKDIPPKEPSSLSFILKNIFISFVDAEIAP